MDRYELKMGDGNEGEFIDSSDSLEDMKQLKFEMECGNEGITFEIEDTESEDEE